MQKPLQTPMGFWPSFHSTPPTTSIAGASHHVTCHLVCLFSLYGWQIAARWLQEMALCFWCQCYPQCVLLLVHTQKHCPQSLHFTWCQCDCVCTLPWPWSIKSIHPGTFANEWLSFISKGDKSTHKCQTQPLPPSLPTHSSNGFLIWVKKARQSLQRKPKKNQRNTVLMTIPVFSKGQDKSNQRKRTQMRKCKQMP